MIDQINSREENGKFIIYLPVIINNSDVKFKIVCIIFILVLDLALGALYLITRNIVCLIIWIILDASLGIYIRCASCRGRKVNNSKNGPKLQEFMMWRYFDSLTIMINYINYEYPFENIKGFSYLKEKGKGIYLELVSGPVVKIVSYPYDDPIVERATLEFNKCLDKLRIKEPLMPNSI